MEEIRWEQETGAVITAFSDVPHAELLLEGLERLPPSIVVICMKRDLMRAIQAATDDA
jgi:hypothetical protein